MTKHPIICLRCGSISDSRVVKSYKCPDCELVTQRDDFEALVDLGRNATLYGIRYRDRYELDLKEHGNLSRRYSLQHPTDVESFVAAAIAGGILGNAAWDGIKLCIKGIYEALKKRKRITESHTEKQPFVRPADVDLLFTLIGDGCKEGDKFIEDVRGYLKGMPDVDPQFKGVIISDESIQRKINRTRDQIAKLAAAVSTKE